MFRVRFRGVATLPNNKTPGKTEERLHAAFIMKPDLEFQTALPLFHSGQNECRTVHQNTQCGKKRYFAPKYTRFVSWEKGLTDLSSYDSL